MERKRTDAEPNKREKAKSNGGSTIIYMLQNMYLYTTMKCGLAKTRGYDKYTNYCMSFVGYS